MGHKKKTWNIFRPSPWYQAVRGGISVALARWMAAWFWWLWNVIQPWRFLVFIFCSMPRKSISNLQITSQITSKKHPQEMICISLSKLYLNFMGFHRFHLQANRSLFIHPAFMAPKSSRTMVSFGGNVGWMNGNQHNWLDGWNVKWINSEKWLGEQTSIDFLLQDLWNVCLFAFFSVPHVQMCHPFFSPFLKQEKWERSPSSATPAMFFVFSFRIWEMPRFFPDLPWTWRLWSCLAWLCESRGVFCRDPKTKLRFWQRLP